MRHFWVLAAGLLFVGSAMAADKAEFAGDVANFVTPTAPAMESVNAAESLATMKGNGRIRLTGDVKARYLYSRVNAARGTFAKAGTGTGAAPASNKDSFENNSWDTHSAFLKFRVDACDGGYLTIKLDLDDAWNNVYDQDDFLEEVYFTMENLFGTGLGSKMGKMEVPFGMDKDVLMLSPYLHGNHEGMLGRFARNGFNNDWNEGRFYGFSGSGNANNRFSWMPAHSVEYDNRFAWVPFWKINDQWLIEAAWFQDHGSPAAINGRFQRPDGRRTNDPALSFSGAVTWTPIEDLKVMASAITRYSDGAGDTAGFGEDRTYASSLAFDWTPCLFGKKVNFFAEWQHAWDPDFIKDSSSDDIHVGTSFNVTDAITLFAQYEWLHGRQDSYLGGTGGRMLVQRALAAVQYSFANGMYTELGYQREWGHVKTANANALNPTFRGKNSAYADTIYGGMGWTF